MVGDATFIYSSKYGYVSAGLLVNEGGTAGNIEWDVQVPLFDGNGNVKTKSQKNSEVRDAIQTNRVNQLGTPVTLNPDINTIDFFPDE